MDRWKKEEYAPLAEDLLALAERAAPWAGAPAVERGSRLLRDGKHDEGVAALLHAIELSGEDPRALALLAGAATSPADAEDYARRALAIVPDDARVLAIRGKALLALGHPKEALDAIEHAQRIDHHDPDAWATRVKALEALGRSANEIAVIRAEADLRRNALRVAQEAIHVKDYSRALEYAPNEPVIVARCVDALFLGSIAFGDPLKAFASIIPLRAEVLLNRVFDRTAIKQINPGDLAPRYETPDGDADDAFTGFVVRVIGIVRERDLRPATLARARVDLERCISRDASALVAVGARGFVLSLERQTQLADEDLSRTFRFASDLDCFIFAHALICAQKGLSFEEDARRLADHERRDEFKAFTDWLPALVKEGR